MKISSNPNVKYLLQAEIEDLIKKYGERQARFERRFKEFLPSDEHTTFPIKSHSSSKKSFSIIISRARHLKTEVEMMKNRYHESQICFEHEFQKSLARKV